MATREWTDEQAQRRVRPAADWRPAGEYTDIRYEVGEGDRQVDHQPSRGAQRVSPRDAGRALQWRAFVERAREDTDVGVVVLTGEGPLAFCSGGDQRVRGDAGYVPRGAAVGRFHVTDLHVQMRRLPKPLVAMVAGYAIGEVTFCTWCAISRSRPTTPASGRPGLRWKLRRWLRRQPAGRADRAQEGEGSLVSVQAVHRGGGLGDGLVNTVVGLEELEEEDGATAAPGEMLELSPFSLRLLKASFDAAEDGLAGIQQLAHDANLLFYMSEEAQEGRDAYRERRRPDFLRFPRGLEPSAALAGRGAAAHAARGGGPRARGHRARGLRGRFGAALRGCRGGQRVHPDRHEPLQRLLRRAPRADTEDRLGPVRVTAGGLMPPRLCAGGNLRGLRGIAVAAGLYLAAVAGWVAARGGRRLDPRRRPVHGRPAALRLRGTGPGVRVPVLRNRRGGRLVLRPDAGAALGGTRPRRARGPVGGGDPRGEQRARHRHRPAGGGSGRWP